ncbi:fumarylacetoacetate hydrolase family protein [Paenibacillus hemerocallicola]|uniref:Fumarylacetoacetate hydrolase family protein n=1 Tax=Paenibacillus hemerocallicola TaxID=1172614 RepID=A0A5C4SWS8_9BACL|nr:fumarylacetoacetate hydrolase family protein [Paenibacillus hemerocallicola]TNJ59279.1 fumarylacetoacetate hydrolase family protein [Paenibacillus hemerocallicola]
MKFLNFYKEGILKLGIQVENGILDLEQASELFPFEGSSTLPTTVLGVIRSDPTEYAALSRYIVSLPVDEQAPYRLNESQIMWGPCVDAPQKLICVGLNYRKHAQETNMPIPEYPVLFNKFNNALTGHDAVIPIPAETAKVDYEAELAIVIGKTARNVSVDDSLDYVFGYCAANDVSARDLQLRTGQWMLGKTCDFFCPLGPYVTTADEVGDPNDLEIRTVVNGEVRQSSHTSDMIFTCREIVSYVSRHFTLQPGDVIMTGTPEGVIMGYPPEKQRYLQQGDEVVVEIEKLGKLKNRFQ